MNKLVKLCQNQQQTVLSKAMQGVIRPFDKLGPRGSYSAQYHPLDVGMTNINMPRQGCGVRGGSGGAV